jgi:hypothetical protein
VWENFYENRQKQCNHSYGEFGVRYSLQDTSPAGHVLVIPQS